MTQPNSWSLRVAVKKALQDVSWGGCEPTDKIVEDRLCAEIETAHEAEMAKIGNELVKAKERIQDYDLQHLIITSQKFTIEALVKEARTFESSVKDLQAALAEKEKRLEKAEDIMVQARNYLGGLAGDFDTIDAGRKLVIKVKAYELFKLHQAEEELARSRPNNAANHLGDL